jgi:preprotein translocase subunit YajC
MLLPLCQRPSFTPIQYHRQFTVAYVFFIIIIIIIIRRRRRRRKRIENMPL